MNTQLMTVAFSLTCMVSAAATEDKVLADFESGTYAPWTVTGEAFGAGPASGPLPGQMNVEGFQGKGLVNSFYAGDDSTGSFAVRPGRTTSKVAARRWRRSGGRWASLLE